jgi:hypothetical protein
VRRLLKTAALATAIGAVMAACTSAGSGGGSGSGSGSTTRSATPAASATTVAYRAGDFSTDVDNRWFPLKPGTTLVYRGTKDEGKALEYFTVSRQTQKVGGVPCRVVLDRLYLDGKLAETTRDYYSQDSKGNVWYFGEDTAELEPDGSMVGTEGTWHTGEAGAQPGVFMPANPRVGESHRQEYYPGHAEDFFQVVDLSASVSVPYKSFSGTMLTKEWTPLEPDVLDHKYYVAGIGEVKEVTVKGPLEELVLIDVKHG